MTSILSAENVWKSFGDVAVLKGLSLDLQQGESLVVIGKSGTGKSVLLKCLLGLMNIDKGAVYYNNLRFDHLAQRHQEKMRKPVSMLFQGSALFDSMNVWRNITFGLNMPQNEARDYAVSLLEQVGLDANIASQDPDALSGGMKRRVALARAVASKPEVILFDEPTTGLDPVSSHMINDIIKSNVKRIGASALTITHDMSSAQYIADRIAFIDHGCVAWQGTPAEIEHADHVELQRFLHPESISEVING